MEFEAKYIHQIESRMAGDGSSSETSQSNNVDPSEEKPEEMTTTGVTASKAGERAGKNDEKSRFDIYIVNHISPPHGKFS